MTIYRVNYNAKLFGFAGWEVYTSNDKSIMADCIKLNIQQMSKDLDEQVTAQILEF